MRTKSESSPTGATPAAHNTGPAGISKPAVPAVLSLKKDASFAELGEDVPATTGEKKPFRMPHMATVTQRMLQEGTEAETRIKIFEDDEITEAYLAVTYTGEEFVYYYEEPKPAGGKAKDKRPRKKIAAAKAFPANKANALIQKEFAQHENAQEIMGGANIPKEMIAYFKEFIAEQEPDREVSDAQIVEMINGIDQFKPFITQQPKAESKVAAKDKRGKKPAARAGAAAAAAAAAPAADEEDTLTAMKQMIAEDDTLIELIMGDVVRTEARVERPAAAAGAGDGGDGGGGGNKEWKSPKTEELRDAIVAMLAGRKGYEQLVKKETAKVTGRGNVLHHKMSRSHLGGMLELFNKTNHDAPGYAAMNSFIATIQRLTGLGAPEKALENWTANLELAGPDRAEGDDPAELFDGSFPKGAATPRTESLQEADLLITHATKAEDVDWTRVAALLFKAQADHVAYNQLHNLAPDAVSRPKLEQWTRAKDGRDGYVRDKPGGKLAAGEVGASAAAAAGVTVDDGGGAVVHGPVGGGMAGGGAAGGAAVDHSASAPDPQDVKQS